MFAYPWLLYDAYDAMLSTLKVDQRAALDRDYLNGQIEYRGNAALFRQDIQNGSEPELSSSRASSGDCASN